MGNARLSASAPVPVAATLSAATEAAGIPAAALTPARLKILHIFRAPLGGLFRHVLDLARGQAARGHRVGLILDSTTGGAGATAALAELAPHLALGFARIPIARHLGMQDIRAWHYVARRIAALAPDVLHGHGAKGAALARLAPGAGNAIRVYTPHGGSLLYAPGTLAGGFYCSLEWLMMFRTDLFLFESSYAAELFRARVGAPRALVRVVRNGVAATDFAPVAASDDATDIVSVGELRRIKGVDFLIEALAILKRNGRRLRATIAGQGPEEATLRAQVQEAGLADAVRFVGFRSAREAFAMGRVVVIPSLGESLPYIVLEAAAAGMPLIATRVGGVPEIFGPQADHLVSPGDAEALAGAIAAWLDDPTPLRRVAQTLRTRVREEFSVNVMVEGGLAAYREAIAMRKVARFA